MPHACSTVGCGSFCCAEQQAATVLSLRLVAGSGTLAAYCRRIRSYTWSRINLSFYTAAPFFEQSVMCVRCPQPQATQAPIPAYHPTGLWRLHLVDAALLPHHVRSVVARLAMEECFTAAAVLTRPACREVPFPQLLRRSCCASKYRRQYALPQRPLDESHWGQAATELL